MSAALRTIAARRAYSATATAQPQTVACFGPLYTKPVKSATSSFATTSDALARQTLRTPLPSATFSAMYAESLVGPLHKRVVVTGPTVAEPLAKAAGAKEACK